MSEWKDELNRRNEDMGILMSIALNQNHDGDSGDLNFDDLVSGVVERNRERFLEDEDLESDLAAGSNDDDDDEDDSKLSPTKKKKKKKPKTKDMYDESMKLLKENCDSYLTQLQDAITSLSQMRKQQNNNISNGASPGPAATPMSPDMMASPSSVQLGSPAMSLADSYGNEHMSLMTPQTNKTMYIGPYMNELDARTKDLQLMHEIFFSMYS